MEIVLGLLLIVCLFLIAAILYDSNRFVTVSYRIEDAPVKKRLRLVLVADLHNKQYGKHNEKLLTAIDAAAPDMILSAGDILSSIAGQSMEPAMDFMKKLSEKYPVYYGNGNHEYRVYHDKEKRFGQMGKQYREALKEDGVRLLENAKVSLPEYGICIYGLDLSESYYRRREKKTALTVKKLENMLGHPEEGSFHILLAHNPDHFEAYADWGADLVLSGHVHGGIVRIPGGKGVISTSLRLFPKYDGGEFSRGKTKMIISRGLGSHTIPVRLFNPAELVVIDLIPQK